ncbi:MAG: selenide, water dikinase SelD [Candidatus Sericytochromatia bacterium]
MGSNRLGQVLSQIPKFESENLLVDLSTNEDAGVYKLNDTTALVQTVDFFTPVLDNPYLYGAVSAANSLSDVYAMGGKPITAMNILCFPNNLPDEILTEILKGGADKVKESGAILLGGHSVKDKEIKFGLSVTGLISPDKVYTNSNLKEDDILVLTKPLGAGILTTALKKKFVIEDEIKDCIDGMMQLNKIACEVMIDTPEVHSCTDITGFGLLGHLKEMCEGSNKGAELYFNKFKFYDKTLEFLEKGAVSGGCKENLKTFESFTFFDSKITLNEKYLLADPQTSGGLLISINQKYADTFLDNLLKKGLNAFIIGKVIKEKVIKIF